MTCVDYLKNFYNDHMFKVAKYAHLLAKVLPMCNKMILKYADSTNQEQNFQVINEVLELYRFIVEKYAGYNTIGENGQLSSNITTMCELAVFLNGFWGKYGVANDENETEERERSLVLSSIMRIMCQIISKMPFEDLPIETVQSVLQIAFK